MSALLGVLGVSVAWMRDVIEHFDLRPLGNVDGNEIAEIFHSWGVRRGEAYRDYLGRFIDTWETGASTWTFAELATNRPGHTLHLTATNVSRGVLTVFDVSRTPHMRVLDAVHASGAIPGFFTPWISQEGEVFCDGAVIEYFPWSCVPNQHETLVVVCEEFGIHDRPWIYTHAIQSFAEYIQRVMRITTQKRKQGTPPRYWIALNVYDIDMIDFMLTREERMGLFQRGATAAARWLAYRTQRLTDSAGGTAQSPPSCAHPCMGSSDHPSQAQMSGNPGYQTPPRPVFPSRGSHNASRRRWSL